MRQSPIKRQQTIRVRVDRDEYRRINTAASRRGMTASEYLRVLGESEEWAMELGQKIQQWMALLKILDRLPAPESASIEQEARERFLLIDSVFMAAKRMADTAIQLQGMLTPSEEELKALLQRLEVLKQAKAADPEAAPKGG